MLKSFARSAALPAALLAAAAFSSPAQAGGLRYEVELTNLTKGQIISPAVVATHRDRAERIFELGAPASAELAAVAEDAQLDPLIDKLSNEADVLDVKTLFGAGGPIMPGESASVVVEALGWYRHISLVAMLVTTNDAFVGLNSVRAPGQGPKVQLVPAYDAGSEANTEMCAHIPGPPCGNGGVRVTDGAEGYVYIHPGISGVGELEPSDFDWRNPVARITIRRVH